MALEEYQTALVTGRLYEVKKLAPPNGVGERLNASIWVNDTSSVYGSSSASQPADLASMTLQDENTDKTGHLVLAAGVSTIPRYISITGSATEIVASGLEVNDLGAIS